MKTLETPIPIRFSDGTRRQIRRVARRFGITPSQIIRSAVEEALPSWERGQFVLSPRKEGCPA
jgi:predicted transcriptional regulator